LLKDIKSQAPQAICELRTQNGTTNLLVNRDKPPFDNADLRRAMMLTLDRKSFIDILSDGQAKIGGAMLPPPEGLWGLPPELLATVPGYDPDVRMNRAAAREIFVEFHKTMMDAILREKGIKKWHRAWKLQMIECQNPQWQDLYDEIVQ
jgi:ABC-type transport system substrate-binding protein